MEVTVAFVAAAGLGSAAGISDGLVLGNGEGLTIVALVGRMRSRAWRFRWMLVAGWVFVGIVIAGCGGGNTIVTLPPTNNGTPPGAYSVTVYVFTESNASDGSNANADASVSIPVTVN